MKPPNNKTIFAFCCASTAIKLPNFISYASIGIHLIWYITFLPGVWQVRTTGKGKIFDVLPAVESIYMWKQIIFVFCRTVFIVAIQSATVDNIDCIQLSCLLPSACLLCLQKHKHTHSSTACVQNLVAAKNNVTHKCRVGNRFED